MSILDKKDTVLHNSRIEKLTKENGSSHSRMEKKQDHKTYFKQFKQNIQANF